MKFLFLALFLACSAFAARVGDGGGDHVNNGGGLAEQNFIYAYQNLDSWLEFCRPVSNPCRLVEKELLILTRIQHELRHIRKDPGLFFKSGRLNPGLFETDEHGKVRVAVTGSNPGDPVYINLDLIYTNATGSEAVVDVFGAIAILVHELGHHWGEPDHLFLDLLGQKVRNRREQFLEQIDLKKYLHPEFRALAHNGEREIRQYFSIPGKRFSRFTLENGHELWDLTPQFTQFISCPAGQSFVASHFTNLIWHRLENFDEAKGLQPFTLSLDLEYACAAPPIGPWKTNSVRIQWAGWFKVKHLIAAGDLLDSEYGRDWQIRDGIRFSLVSSEARKL